MAKIDMSDFTKPLILLALLNDRLTYKAKNHLLFKYAISQLIGIQHIAMGWL
jgi:hypothetical protein